MAHLLALPARLLQYYADRLPRRGCEKHLCAIAGPLFSPGFGGACRALCKRFQQNPEGLLLPYLPILGTSISLGNLFPVSLAGGDFGVAAKQMYLSAAARLVITVAGGLLLAGFLYRMGYECLRGTPPQENRLRTVIQAVVRPAALGTVLVMIAFLPVPPAFIEDWIASLFFWVFAAAGVVVA